MKHFDPARGWVETSAPQEGDGKAETGTVFHFSRRGARLDIRTAMPAASAEPVGRAAELAAAREALVDVLQALEPNPDTASAVDEVRDTLQCLEQLHRDRERLQGELRRIDGQIEATQRLLEASLIAAEEQERRQLDSQRLRATLVGEMAQAIVGRTKDGAA